MDFGLPPVLASGFTIIAFILGAMALVGLVEILDSLPLAETVELETSHA